MASGSAISAKVYSRIGSSSPMMRSLLVWLAVSLPLILFGAHWLGSYADRLLTERSFQSLRADLTLLRADFDRGGIGALTDAVAARARLSDGGLYRLETAVPTPQVAGNFSHFPEGLTSSGDVFQFQSSGGGGPRTAAGLVVDVPGGGRMLVARDISDQVAFASRLSTAAFLGVSAATLAGLLLGWRETRRYQRRISGMTATSQSIMAGDLSQRISRDQSGDELDHLAGSLNAMFERIETLMQAMREVSDNIAHDLKTPLTRLRNRAEAALRDPRGGPAFAEGLERTIEEADELIKTFNALLSIARLEAGSGVDQAQTIDLVEIVRDAVELYEPVADEAGVKIVFEPAPGLGTSAGAVVAARADRQLLGQTLANLIENALKYGCEPGSRDAPPAKTSDIVVDVRTRPGWAEISVSDHGPGIPAADRERVLKRFVRLDSSRSRPGTGLGLSLVAAVARLHNGYVRLEDNSPGLRIVLSLPTLAARSTMDAV